MSDQHVTEAEKSCIADAPKRKSLGQVGYEAMVSTAGLGNDFPGHELSLRWENQPPLVQASWELIALAITTKFSVTLMTELQSKLGVKL